MRYKVNDPETDAEISAAGESRKDSMFLCRHGDRCGIEKKFGKRVTKLAVIVGLLTMTVAVIALLVTFTLQIAIFQREAYTHVCQTEECAKTAARVIDAMNISADPCQDFYEFACGGWISKNPIPQSQTSWDQLSLLREQLLKNLRILLEESDDGNDLRPVKLARDLYRVCMDTKSVESLGLQPIHDTLAKIGLPRDPPLEDDVLPLDLPFVAGKVQRLLGLNMLVNFYVGEDIRDTSKNRMTVDQASPGFSARYLLNPALFQSELSEYRKYIRSMVELAGGGNKSDDFANEIVAFSTEIAKIMTSPEERRSSTHLIHDVTVNDLQELTDMVGQRWNWTRYFEAVFDDTNVTIDTSVDRVLAMDLSYLQKLPELLTVTSPATIARFVWWSIYTTIAPLTLQRFRDLGFQFAHKVFGLNEKIPRWKNCIGTVNTNFGMALSHVYARKYFDNRAQKKALEMLLDVKTAFDQMVSELDWMDGETRSFAQRKLLAIRPFVGIPDWISDSKELTEFYEQTDVLPGRLFDTLLFNTYAGIKENLENLREKPDNDRWITSGMTVNAYYSPILNSVTFPAGILHPPFYGNGLESINYGAMGAIMGHELTHGFDDQGRRYDEKGNLRQWWSNETLRHFRAKVECMVKQYSNYHVPELGNNFTVNGANTEGENIADNGGLREAYRAYKSLKKRRGSAENLPGLSNYTQEQLFFVGFAQAWCGDYTNGALKSFLIDGVHAPNHFRVIGTLSNNADFAMVWKCPIGSPMNPPNKCILW